MFVGGEFYDDSVWEIDSPALPFKDAIFLNGGRACLSVIADYLCANQIQEVLLPAYLCPSILDVLDQHKFNYSFYKINEDFSIDLRDMHSKADLFQVIYFINYFGFQHSSETITLLRQFQSSGKLLIEDNAQAGFITSPIGDFCFNSMRKICAFDGGYLATRNNLSPFTAPLPSRANHRLPLIRDYRRRLRAYLFEGVGNYNDLESLFYQAELNYELDGLILGDAGEKAKIEKLDWNAIKEFRRSNYNYLLEQLNGVPGVHPIFSSLQADNMPLGLPVYVRGAYRDQLLDLLADESISLTVHWDALISELRIHQDKEVINMASHILTLPVDQYTSKSQLDYMVDHLTRFVTQLSMATMS